MWDGLRPTGFPGPRLEGLSLRGAPVQPAFVRRCAAGSAASTGCVAFWAALAAPVSVGGSTPPPIPAPSPAREVRVKFTRGVDFSWQTQALLALQEAAEAFLVRLFENACLLSLHASRLTLSSKDAQRAGGSDAFKGTAGLRAPTRVSGGYQSPCPWLGPHPWGTRCCLHLLSLSRVCELLS